MKEALDKDNELMIQFVVAEKLGYTVSELQERMTLEELQMWSVFYQLRSDHEQAAINKAKRQSKTRR